MILSTPILATLGAIFTGRAINDINDCCYLDQEDDDHHSLAVGFAAGFLVFAIFLGIITGIVHLSQFVLVL